MNDGLAGGKAAVRKHAFHLPGQGRTCSHQHGCSAHGDAGENDFHILPKVLHHKVNPGMAIPVLFDAKGNDMSVAFPIGTLIDKQGVSTQRKATLYAPAQPAFAVAFISVK